MNILICPDKFRGSLDAQSVAEALAKGFSSQLPTANITLQGLADGGEGTFALLTASAKAETINLTVQNPLGEPVMAQYGFCHSTQTAYLEMSQASGLALLKPSQKNPLHTHTFGTGQMIVDALERGAKHIIMGIGGSATNDAGIGMASALDYVFFDKNNKKLSPCGKNLDKIFSIDNSQIIDLEGVKFTIACDVDNPLFGQNGAAQVYAPQKGATPDMVKTLDNGLEQFASIVKKQFQKDLAEVAGAGAAGGLGYGAMLFLSATLRSGIDLIMEETKLETLIKNSDYIITGEGKLDEQSLQGKVVAGVAALAKKHNKPVVAVCGTLALSPTQARNLGLDYAESIITRPMSLSEAQENAAFLLSDWAARFSGLIT